MFIYPHINPVAFSLGPVQVHWYGLMYLLGFVSAWWLGCHRARVSAGVWQEEEVSDLIFYGALGVVLGGRLGYILFYYLPVAGWADPWIAVRVWEGGMSFHGGLLGVLLAMVLFCRKHQKDFFTVMDFVAPLVPIGLGAGRMGNFINGELWGRVTDVPWAMVFPHVDNLPRHPSQLYQCLLEGLVLFMLLWCFSNRPRPKGAISALFLLAYGCFRFLVEFFRQPDQQLGFIAAHLTMGQLLSLPLIVLGALLLFYSYKRTNLCSNIST